MKNAGTLVFLAIYVIAEGLLSAPVLWGVTPEDAATAIYGTIEGSYGSESGFEERVSRPVTSGDTLMYTLDGSKSFNAQLTCPSTSKFLEVSITALSTGDLKATIRQDTDFDGIADYTYAPPADISGVCSNGVVSCDAGTWQNCKYYSWISDATSFQAILQTASITELGGCYCINQGCGASYSDYSSVLKDIGGGAAGGVPNVEARYATTDANIAAYTIFYYGQAPAGCPGASS